VQLLAFARCHENDKKEAPGMETYERPTIRDLGTVRDLTKQSLNKVGSTPDLVTGITNGVVIGSFVAV
jgi:hypothetical protein